MSLWDKVRGWFTSSGSGDEEDGSAFYLYIACERCTDLVAVRINRQSDLAQRFDTTTQSVSGYELHKGVVDQRCFRPIQVVMTFDAGQRELSREISGGRFLTREEFEAARAGTPES